MKRDDRQPDRLGSDAKTERERRLAEALRENLRKRKEQQRARDAGPDTAPGAGPTDEHGS